MPTFDTPSPVRVTLSLAFGQVRIVASDSSETRVEAYPCNCDDQDDVWTAAQLSVDYADGRLFVNVPEPSGSGGAIVVVIAVPTGSSVHGRGTAVDFLGAGELGECRLGTGLGHIRLQRTGDLQLTAALGDITVDHTFGTVDATTHRGDVHLGLIEDSATITANGEGDVTVGEVHGVAHLHAEKGAIEVRRAHADVEARTIDGDIDVGEVQRGSVVTATTFGSIRVAVAGASSARLSLDTAAGTVYTALSLLEERGQADEVVRIEARTVMGDVVVERADAE